MIDIRQLRENPERFRQGARDKNAEVDLDRLLALDAERRDILQRLETRRAEQNRLSKEIGPQIGKLKGQLKTADGAAKAAAEAQLAELSAPLGTSCAGGCGTVISRSFHCGSIARSSPSSTATSFFSATGFASRSES